MSGPTDGMMDLLRAQAMHLANEYADVHKTVRTPDGQGGYSESKELVEGGVLCRVGQVTKPAEQEVAAKLNLSSPFMVTLPLGTELEVGYTLAIGTRPTLRVASVMVGSSYPINIRALCVEVK